MNTAAKRTPPDKLRRSICLRIRTATPLVEERFTRGFEDPHVDRYCSPALCIEIRTGHRELAESCSSRIRYARSVYDRIKFGPVDSRGTHWARLTGSSDNMSAKIDRAKRPACASNDVHFCVCRRITACSNRVMGLVDYFALCGCDHRAEWTLA